MQPTKIRIFCGLWKFFCTRRRWGTALAALRGALWGALVVEVGQGAGLLEGESGDGDAAAAHLIGDVDGEGVGAQDEDHVLVQVAAGHLLALAGAVLGEGEVHDVAVAMLAVGLHLGMAEAAAVHEGEAVAVGVAAFGDAYAAKVEFGGGYVHLLVLYDVGLGFASRRPNGHVASRVELAVGYGAAYETVQLERVFGRHSNVESPEARAGPPSVVSVDVVVVDEGEEAVVHVLHAGIEGHVVTVEVEVFAVAFADGGSLVLVLLGEAGSGADESHEGKTKDAERLHKDFFYRL